MKDITQQIFNKLRELETNPNTPFVWVEQLPDSTDKKIYTQTHLIHFSDTLYRWEINYVNSRHIEPYPVEIMCSRSFLEWIEKFKPTSKKELIAQLLAEEEDLMRLRCERSNADYNEVRKSIEKEMQQCFMDLK